MHAVLQACRYNDDTHRRSVWRIAHAFTADDIICSTTMDSIARGAGSLKADGTRGSIGIIANPWISMIHSEKSVFLIQACSMHSSVAVQTCIMLV